MAVNTSLRQLLQPDFVAEVRQALAQAGLPPHRLVIEVTESVFNEDDIDHVLEEVRGLDDGPRGGVGGKASDIEIQAREILRMRERLNKIFSDATGQPIDRIKKDTDRDLFMTGKQAVEYGLIDKVVEKHSRGGT